MPLPPIVIDRRDAIAHFHALLRGEDDMRVMRMVGDAKMGKTHLMSRVFPHVAGAEYQADCAHLDMRNAQQSVADYLHILHDALGGDRNFPTYAAAYEEWLNRPRAQVKGLSALLSSIKIDARDAAEDARREQRVLTSRFVEDLTRLNGRAIIFLFDAVNDANEEARTWLCDTFLVQLARLGHVRAVVSGRTVPEPYGSYAVCCDSFELKPVMDEQEYITFCQKRQIALDEQSIRNFARAVRYAPGQFVDLVEPVFGRGGAYG